MRSLDAIAGSGRICNLTTASTATALAANPGRLSITSGSLGPGTWLVHVNKTEHRRKLLLLLAGEATARREVLGLAEGAKQPVPQRDVAVVVGMHAQLMVDGVVLGPLDEPTQPARRADVGVVEVGPQRAEQR